MLDQFKQIVNRNDTPGGHAFDLTIQALIVLSLVTFSIETLPGLSPTFKLWLDRIEVVTVLIFTAEYLIRLLLEEKKLNFVLSFFGVIDLLAVVPFYLAIGLDFRSVRIVRFLRLFRAFKMVRYSAAIQRFHRAFSIAKEELVLFVIVTVMLLYFSAVGIYFFENDAQPDKFASVFHSLWWAVATLTTVGYGDIYPITVGGRVFTFAVLLVGLGIVSVPAGLLASALSKARALEESTDHKP